jgi:hypothetical protein
MAGLRIHWVTCSKCEFKQLLRKSNPYTGPDFRYQIYGSKIWYQIIPAYAWCPKCKIVREVETLDISPVQSRLNQLLLEEETFRLKHAGVLERIKRKIGLSDKDTLQQDIKHANRLIKLLKSRTDRKCLWCGFPAPSVMFESGSEHPSQSCRGGILTEQVEQTGIHLDFDNSCRKVRWYSAEGVFLREDNGLSR